MFLQKGNQFSVECHSRLCDECLQHGEFCDSKEEAEEWVEDECWIFSGEGWICIYCNTAFMRNLVSVRRDKQQEDKPDKDLGDLEVGIPTIL